MVMNRLHVTVPDPAKLGLHWSLKGLAFTAYETNCPGVYRVKFKDVANFSFTQQELEDGLLEEITCE